MQEKGFIICDFLQTGERQDMWKVKASRVKKPDTEEEDDEFKAAITTPKLTELENTQHLRSAQK